MGDKKAYMSLIREVPKLTGDNYHEWKFSVQLVLSTAECSGVTATDENGNGKLSDEKESTAFTIIGLTIDPSLQVLISGETEGSAAWKILRDEFEKHTHAYRIALKKAYRQYRHDPNLPIRHFITGVTDAARKLRAVVDSATVDDTDIMDVILGNLDESWSTIAATLMQIENLTLKGVKDGLIAEETRANPEKKPFIKQEDVATMALTTRVAPGAPKVEQRKCYHCGKVGHIMRNCRQALKAKEAETQEGAATEKPQEKIVATAAPAIAIGKLPKVY